MRRGRTSTVLIISMMMGATLLTGCGTQESSAETVTTTTTSTSSKSTDTSEETANDKAENTIYGVITKVNSKSVTVNVGTLNQKEEPKSDSKTNEQTNQTKEESDKNSSNSSTKDSKEDEKTQAEPKSMITTTGKTKKVSITSNTKVIRSEIFLQDGEQAPKPNGNEQETKKDGSDNNKQKGNVDKGNAQNQEDKIQKEREDKKASGNEKETKELSVQDLKKNDEVSIAFDSSGNALEIRILSGDKPSGTPGGNQPGQTAAPTSYSSVKEYNKNTSVKNKTYTSTGTDENAIHVTNGAKVSLKNVKLSRKSSKSTGGDSSSFYGVGAALLTTNGTSYISKSKINTNSAGGAGVFSYGKGVSYVSNTTINTKKDTSGGIHVAGGGKLYAWNVKATTKGESSAAIRSDRGGGTMVVDGGTYTSNGAGSPAVYSTANIAIRNAKLTANKSESVCIEGLNSLRLFHCNLSGNMPENDQNDCDWNVILYQSMSGDSEVGNSTFEMNGGSLTAKNGGMFYTTNTESTFYLSKVNIQYAKNNDFFLKCTGNSNKRGWGTSGSNGADCKFTAQKQAMKGDIIWDSISKLDFYMSDGSTLKGAVKDDESNAGNGGSGYCNLYLGKGCTWTVTGNSTLTNLYHAGTIVDEDGKTVTIKGNNGKVYVKGRSKYTVTVSNYSKKVDFSGMTKATSWSDYKVENKTKA